MLHAAVAAGADAVYLGMGEFNARRNADNFDEHTLAEACDYAHLRGVRIYVAMNTIVLPGELESAVDQAKLCWRIGADAFIVQDIGLLTAIRKALPDAPIHISTQMSIHSQDGILAAAALGAKRVTLARELSLEEISHLHGIAHPLGMELEAFAHGALCVCYSGQCLMSSMIGGRSANRGLCAQACRLPYELVDMRDPDKKLKSPGPHLLSPKDLCTVDMVASLMKAGVSSLKIEGRMKSPEYVHTVVSVYRKAIDDLKAPQEARTRLESVFSRGFTTAYAEGARGNEIMSYQRPNNRGQLVGRVKQVRDDAIQLSTEMQLAEGDLLEAWTSRSNVTFPVPSSFAQKGKTVTMPIDGDAVKNAHHIHPNDRVFRVRSVESSFKDDPREPRIPVEGKATLKIGEPLKIEMHVATSGQSASSQRDAACHAALKCRAMAQGEIIESARTKPVTRDDVYDHVNRLGNTPFVLTDFDVELDENVGIGFSQIHRVRAQALDNLEQTILESYECSR